jgi:16S rRNA (cytosine1402-N4)-methyltransferase
MTSDESNRTDPPEPPDAGGPQPPRRRRARYRGTHPRAFEQRYKELAPQAYPGIHEHIRQQGRTPAGTHVPVLLEEVLARLDPQAGDVVVDCTLGYGGHAEQFCRRIAPTGRLIGLDLDAEQLRRTGERLAAAVPGVPLSLHQVNFAGLGKVLAAEGLDGCDVLLADLGVSSMQIDDPARGLSYKHDGPLDMRLGPRVPRTAADLLAEMAEEELAAMLRDLADEPDAASIARQIVQARQKRPITRTGQLVEIILRAKGGRGADHHEPAAHRAGPFGNGDRHRIGEKHADSEPVPISGDEGPHPAARTFQALRIAVNNELENLAQLLRVLPYCLRSGGRVGIISFHSGEDRLVKHAFREGLRLGNWQAIAEEVIRPAAAEVRANPRSSPAKFRWARKGPVV